MKIYIDLILFLNFMFDFLLLLSVSIILKRNIEIYRIMIGAFIGSLSILILFFKINSITLFIIKIMISVLMVLITFSYKNLKYFLRNIIYLYMSSIILGGFLYLLNIEFSYKQEGLIFYHNGLSINFIVLIIFSPIILYIYVRQGIRLKKIYSNYYKVDLYINNKLYKLNGYLDTGNTLSYKKKSIILVNKKIIKNIKLLEKVYVTYQTIDSHNLLECIDIDKIVINNNEIKEKLMVGLINNNIKIDGIDCLLPRLEELND